MSKHFEQLNYLERYRNEGTRSYSSHAAYSEAKEPYSPTSTQPSFQLPCYRVPLNDLNIYRSNPPVDLEAIYIQSTSALICIHPQVLEEQEKDLYLAETIKRNQLDHPLTVSPGSSTRTLHVLDRQPRHALKVHFPFRISRYGRKMRDEVIEQAINISRELEAGVSCFDEQFAFMREVIGVSYKDRDPRSERGENWGYLVRDMRPFPPKPEDRQLFPGFSLYGRDRFEPHKEPLLYQLIGTSDPCGQILEQIMLPIIRHWVTCFLNVGGLLEPHGQNTLFEADEKGQICRVVHRDLSLAIDMRRRRRLNLPDDTLNQYNRVEDGRFHSITYDNFMGHHFFDRIIETCQMRHPKVTAEDFRRPCREEFSRIFPNHHDYLPGTVHYFSENRDQYDKPYSYDTGEHPVWRPKN